MQQESLSKIQVLVSNTLIGVQVPASAPFMYRLSVIIGCLRYMPLKLRRDHSIYNCPFIDTRSIPPSYKQMKVHFERSPSRGGPL